ncbi:hypothetical protein Plhal304r1_c055g0140301 [Plasmopara halstedii]
MLNTPFCSLDFLDSFLDTRPLPSTFVHSPKSTMTNVIDKRESNVPTGSDAEPVYSSLENVSTSQRKPKKSTIKVKSAVATVLATEQLSEVERLGNLSIDHPYLSVLYKRIRSHRKKLEKIKSLELAQQHEGKVPNAQQLDLMSNKATFEKLVAELEMLREQFIGVFSEELKKEKLQEAETVTVCEQPREGYQEPVDTEVVALESEHNIEEIQENRELSKKEKEFADVIELLKALHVVNLHQALGKEVPMVLDFFSKMLLGITRPPAELSYDENLMESLEEAKKYLTNNDKIFACETTYSELKVFVNELASDLSNKGKAEEKNDVLKMAAKNVVEENEKSEVEEPINIPVVPAEINTMPQISFFTESQLEAEHDNLKETNVVNGSLDAAVEVKSIEETCTNSEIQNEEKGEVQDESSSSIPTPPLSFAAVAAGVTTKRTTSPSASSDSSHSDKKARGNSPQKSQRRRNQGRWREKSSNSSGNKTNGSSTDAVKQRLTRVTRSSDDNKNASGGKRNNRSKEDRRPRFDREMQKQGDTTQQATATLIAPHA